MGKEFALIEAFFLEYLKGYEIATIFKKQSDGFQFFEDHEELPICLKIFNHVSEESAQHFGRKIFEELPVPYYQYYFGEKLLPVSESQLWAYDILSPEDSKALIRRAFKVNILLKSFFERRNARLMEFKSYFGKKDEALFFIGECSPLSLKVKLNSEVNFENILNFKNSSDLKNYTLLLKGLIQ